MNAGDKVEVLSGMLNGRIVKIASINRGEIALDAGVPWARRVRGFVRDFKLRPVS